MLDPVSHGKPFRPSAADTNAIHAFVKRGMLSQRVAAPPVSGPQTGGAYVLARNDTGADLDQWKPVGLEGQVFADYTGDGFMQQAVMIALDDDYHRILAVAQTPVADGAIGLFCVAGFTLGLAEGTLLAKGTEVLPPQSGLGYYLIGSQEFTVRASGYSVLVTDRKWSYSFIPQRPKASPPSLGSDSFFEDVPDVSLELGLNWNEDRNTAGATVQGNDVDFNAAPFGADGVAGTLKRRLKPLGPNRPLVVKRWVRDADDVLHPVVDAPNAIQEDCQTEEV